MLELRGRTFRMCDGVDRRSFLKVGALGLPGLGLSEILAARQAQAAADRKDTAVILFWMAGGPSHLETYDMKPQAPDAVRGPFNPIQTYVPGLQLCELLPRHVAVSDKISIIRSLRHDLSVHDDASHWVQTGYPLLQARARGQQNPAQGAVVSCLRGANQPGMPAYVCIPERYSSPRGFYQSPAFLSSRYEAVNAGGDPALGNYRRPEFTMPAELPLARLQDRRRLLQAVDGLAARAEQSGVVEGMNEVQRQAFELVSGPRAREAFDATREPAALHERYGRHAWGQAALLSRRLVEAGVTFVTINLYEADVDWWDDHTTIEKNMRNRLPKFDQALATLISDLHDRGLGERVLVAAFGEFGRGPRIDQGAGRGHWPRAMSALLSGGGIQGGRIIGSTTPDGGDPADRVLGPGDLLATIYRSLGIDSETMLPDRQNRPIRLVEAGQPIDELF